MATDKISVTIGRDGSIRAVTHGVTGEACLDYLPLLEDLLDAEIVDSAFTGDYTATTVPVDTVGAQVQAATQTATETVREPGS